MTPPKDERHPVWQVGLYYPAPASVPYGKLVALQMALAPHMVVELYKPTRGWGHGGTWLWFSAHRRRAVSALWAAAWAHRYVRRIWRTWACGEPALVPGPVKVTVTRVDIEEQRWY